MAVCSFLGHSDIYDADIDTTLQSSIFMSDRELFIFDRLLEGKRPTEAAALVGLSIERSRQVLYHGCKMIRRKLD